MRHRTHILLAVTLLGTTHQLAASPYAGPAGYPRFVSYGPPLSPGIAGPFPGPMHVAYLPPARGYPWAPVQRPPTASPALRQHRESPPEARHTEQSLPRGDTTEAVRTVKAESAETPQAADPRHAFLARLSPLLDKENDRIASARADLARQFGSLEQGDELSDEQRARIGRIAREYRVEGDPLSDADARDELLRRVDVIPVSLALAQAANESAWGKSRFAREGNNLFGIWTYDESKGMVPRKRAAGSRHLVRKFDSIEQSVRYYLLTLNSHPAYAEFRDLRAQMRAHGEPLDGLALAGGLTRYSAKGEDYVATIRDMIRQFELAAFDDATRRSG